MIIIPQSLQVPYISIGHLKVETVKLKYSSFSHLNTLPLHTKAKTRRKKRTIQPMSLLLHSEIHSQMEGPLNLNHARGSGQQCFVGLQKLILPCQLSCQAADFFFSL